MEEIGWEEVPGETLGEGLPEREDHLVGVGQLVTVALLLADADDDPSAQG